ncbi:MAG: hypothetical protein HW373_835 [Deltaproteobacteria bacterium]|nr:hypothetical protein [Deltaproteobacteria bacterium]
MGEITLELRLVFQIPETGLTINGLIDGLKEAVGEIDELWCQLWCLTCHSGVTLVTLDSGTLVSLWCLTCLDCLT